MNPQYSEEERATISRVAQSFNLTDVRAVVLHAAQVSVVPEGTAGFELTIGVNLQQKPHVEGAAILGNFRLGAKPAGSDGADVYVVKYSAIAFYALLKGAAMPDKAALQLFAECNTMIHLWPYFRAFASSASAQMGFPLLTIPVFRPGNLKGMWAPASGGTGGESGRDRERG
ncbi:MAG: hypothetical protein ACK4N5_08150 [Myxococcales bacterium]